MSIWMEKNTEKYGNIRKKKLMILIFLTKHSSRKYSACHKLLNMQNIYTLPSMLIWKLLIRHHVSSLNIAIVFPLTTPILHFFLSQERRHLCMKRRNNSRIVRVETFCNVFKLYANSHNNTKLNYKANSITLLLVSHYEVKCCLSVDLTTLTIMQWAITQYECKYNNIMLCMDSKVAT